MRRLVLLLGAAAACVDDRQGPAGAPSGGVAGTAGQGGDAISPVNPATGLRLAAFPAVPPLPEWPDNPPGTAKKELGRALFWDSRLSGSGTAVCSNCHLATTNFQSATPLDTPDRSYPDLHPTLPRHTPSLVNVVYAPMMRWDGSHFTDLADMMVLPFAEPNMNLSGLPVSRGTEVDLAGAQAALRFKVTEEIPGYVALFQAAFSEDVRTASPERVWRMAGQALAVFIRVAVSRDAPFDRWNAGDDAAISPGAQRGAALFDGRAGCASCHSGPFLSDFEFHNISTAPPDATGKRPDDGRFLVTGREEDRGKFLTPMLRGVARTSPYLHDGSLLGIREVVRHKTGPTRQLDPLHDPVLDRLPALSDGDLDDLVAFLKSLDGQPIPLPELTPPARLP